MAGASWAGRSCASVQISRTASYSRAWRGSASSQACSAARSCSEQHASWMRTHHCTACSVRRSSCLLGGTAMAVNINEICYTFGAVHGLGESTVSGGIMQDSAFAPWSVDAGEGLDGAVLHGVVAVPCAKTRQFA
ncbi:Uncharacterised protein [Bordetella pertussis]|nr:Uncharacterised protein [Bordetella pertussis]